MKILSVNVGLPREVSWQGKFVTTGIFKESVKGPLMLRTLNLDGDGQADLTVKALRRAIEVEALPENWKGYFQHQLEKQSG
jgi:hypothetical protein